MKILYNSAYILKMKLLMFMLMISSISIACHESYLNLVSGPTDIGGGQYSTTVQVCIGQTVNWGGTEDFTITIAGATYVSYAPTTLTNTYDAWLGASCGGPNCFMNSCGSVTATATGTLTSSTVVTFNTTSSTPATWPLVPDDVEACGGSNPTSYCFNFTFVTTGCPTSVSLGGNTEQTRPRICQITCGFSATYPGGPCNGDYEPAMTLSLICTPLPIELMYFEGHKYDDYNLLEWVSASESNNDYYLVEHSLDGIIWTDLTRLDGAGNSSQPLLYQHRQYNHLDTVNYYKLTQVDYDGAYEVFKTISIDNRIKRKELVGRFNLLGEIVRDDYNGFVIEVYSDGSTKKYMTNTVK